MMAARGFDTTPKPAFLRAMQNQKWTVAGALAELVDNSFGPGRGNADTVRIVHDIKDRTITIVDNGQGMEAIGRLFQLGNTIGRAPGDIGMYGSGGTMALLWLARRVSVITIRRGQYQIDAVDWHQQIKSDAFPIVSDEWRSLSGMNPSIRQWFDESHGTLIQIDLLPERHLTAQAASNVRRDLAKTYAPGLRLGKRIEWTSLTARGDSSEYLADPLRLPDDEDRLVRIDMAIEVGEQLLTVEGIIGMIDDLPITQSTVTVGFGARVITTTRDCYSSPDGEDRYSGVGVAGWLDLGEGWQPYLATTKDVMNDKPVWDLLMGFVFEHIRHLLHAADTQKLSIELDELSLMLENALDGLSDLAAPGGIERPETPDRSEPEGPGPAHDPKPDRPDADQDGTDADKPAPAKTTIHITQLSDNEMKTLLVRAESIRDHIDVYVNEDHDLIKTAMRQSPVNRELLRLAALGAVALVLIDHPDLLRKLSPPLVRIIDGQDDTREKEGLVLRHLMDKSRKTA